MEPTKLDAAANEVAGLQHIAVDQAAVDAANRAAPAAVDPVLAHAGPMRGDVFGAGDQLVVTVFENVDTPLLGGAGQRLAALPQMTVDRSGAVFVPYIGPLQVAGRTAEQVRVLITQGLAAQTPSPQVVVERIPGKSETATLAGAVQGQGLVPLVPQANTLSTIIAAAGGAAADPADVVVTLSRGSHSAKLRLDEVMTTPALDLPVKAGDRIILREDKRRIAVLGATTSQGAVSFSGTSYALTSALAAAGGLNAGRASARGVFVLRGPAGDAGAGDRLFQFDLRSPQGLLLASRFFMRDGDMLYVAPAPFAELTQILNAMRQTAATGDGLVSVAQ